MANHDEAGVRLIAVTEEELQRVVLDIHDGPVQNLFAALGQLSLARSRLNAHSAEPPEVGPAIGRAITLLEGALQSIRDVITPLHAPAFAERTLKDIVEELVVQHETLTDDVVALDLGKGLPEIAPVAKIALFRVLQEALSNIRRHAGSSTVEVTLSAAGGSVVLEIVDHGRGFEPPPLVGPHATEAAIHIGLRGMRERVVLVGGSFSVTSRPGAGTSVRVEIPPDV